MNTNFGLIGKKLGNTQVFDEDGTVARCTAILVGPCTVLGKRTPKQDGYSALILGFGERREKLVNKPEMGLFKKIGQKPLRTIKEFRLPADKVDEYEVGQQLKPSDAFEAGQKVDVCGTSKGAGFAGVFKRYHMSGPGTDGHGAHEVKRHGGSIGANLTPGRTLPNKKMPGQHGNKRVTTHNIKVYRVMDDEQMILLRGAVPGSRDGILTIRATVKAPPKS